MDPPTAAPIVGRLTYKSCLVAETDPALECTDGDETKKPKSLILFWPALAVTKRSQNVSTNDLEELGNKTGALHVGQAPATASETGKRGAVPPTGKGISCQDNLPKPLLYYPKAIQNRA